MQLGKLIKTTHHTRPQPPRHLITLSSSRPSRQDSRPVRPSSTPQAPPASPAPTNAANPTPPLKDAPTPQQAPTPKSSPPPQSGKPSQSAPPQNRAPPVSNPSPFDVLKQPVSEKQNEASMSQGQTTSQSYQQPRQSNFGDSGRQASGGMQKSLSDRASKGPRGSGNANVPFMATNQSRGGSSRGIPPSNLPRNQNGGATRGRPKGVPTGLEPEFADIGKQIKQNTQRQNQQSSKYGSQRGSQVPGFLAQQGNQRGAQYTRRSEQQSVSYQREQRQSQRPLCPTNPDKADIPININIKRCGITEVRVKQEGGGVKDLGLLDALKEADALGLDVILISEQGRVVQYALYQEYAKSLKKKAKAEKRKAKQREMKSLKLSAAIEIGDMKVKAKQATKFLKQQRPVRFELRLKGREINFVEVGVQKLEDMSEMLEEYGVSQKVSNQGGGNLQMLVTPKRAGGGDSSDEED